ncbi:MAG: hypothetical protein GY754_23145 [bacterium]|nr:hypothetical protein [bacterium]
MSASKRFELHGNRTIYLQSIYQYEIYSGLLEGLPTKEMNKGIINEVIEKAVKLFDFESAYLIKPIEKEKFVHFKNYPFGEPAALPEVACMGFFHSLEYAKNKEMDYSYSVIVWFQDQYAFPVDPIALKEIEEIKWETIAVDYEY